VCVREVGSARAQQCLLAQNPLATDILHLVYRIWRHAARYSVCL
jgi:hypothetical protein